MNSMYRSLRNENGTLRGRSGSGEPGLWTLLGGTGGELDSSELTMTGGSGAVGSTAKLARAHNDVRMAQVASGSTSGSGYAGGGGGGYYSGGRLQTK